jgi:hypothetical protein
MAITRRVTARYRSRHMAASQTPAASPSGDNPGKSDVRNLPVAELHSGIVDEPAASPPVSRFSNLREAAPPPVSLSSHLCEARARAEEILSQHPRREGPWGSMCQLCLVAYPCDAMRAAGDVIAISAKLQLGQPLSGAALLELMTELVALGATDTALRRPTAEPPVPRATSGPGTDHGLEDAPRRATH